jgi:MoaA/NifB/PqqE/SkfB family radical SAM enzyme
MTFPSIRDLRRAYNDLRWMYNDALSRHAYVERDVVLTARPQFLIIDPTSVCNARCVMCPVSFRAPSDHGTDLRLELFEKLLPIISAASHVNLFATGEPTLAEHLVHFVTETRKRTTSPIWVSTNGKRLPPDVPEILAAPGMGLQFSVDGGTKEVFEPIRRGIAFEQLCHSLAMASDRRGSGAFPTLSFSCTMSKRNIHDLANIFALAQRYRVDQVLFYDEDPESPEEEQYVLDESDRPIFEAQWPFIESTGIRYSNGLTFRGAAPARPMSGAPLMCRAPW